MTDDPQQLRIPTDLIDEIRCGLMRVNVRKGKRKIVPGPLEFRSSARGDFALVRVTEVEVKKAGELPPDTPEMELCTIFYPDIKPTDDVTVIKFYWPCD